MRTDITRSGPLFDGRFAAEMREALVELEDDLGNEGADRVRQRLDVVLQNPTGFYRSRVRSFREGEDRIVNDSRVIYGPWLEGVSTRNATSRFKGYRTFDRVYRQLDRDAQELGEAVIGRFLR